MPKMEEIQDYAVKSPTNTNPAVLASMVETYAEESNIQSDWNENDPQNPAYVKNRPFYIKEQVITEIVPEFTGNFIRDEDYQFSVCDEKTFTIELGEELCVYWDNTPYYVTVLETDGILYMGNLGLTGDAPLTEEPFLYNPYSGFATSSTEATHTIKVVKIDEQIQAIPLKYIPLSLRNTIKAKTGQSNEINGEIYNDYLNNSAGEWCSHAEGSRTKASGDCSHAEGSRTTASGGSSHAEGYGGEALGNQSHAEGTFTKAIGRESHAEGYSTVAAGDFSHVFGKYNIIDTDDKTETGIPNNKYVCIVGNSDSTTRSNAHTLDWQGNSWYQGRVLIGGTDMDSPDAELTPTSVIIKSSTPSSAKRFKITVTDDGAIKAEEVI